MALPVGSDNRLDDHITPSPVSSPDFIPVDTRSLSISLSRETSPSSLLSFDVAGAIQLKHRIHDLESEIQKSQDREAKLSQKVDSLREEKKALERQLQESQSELYSQEIRSSASMQGLRNELAQTKSRVEEYVFRLKVYENEKKEIFKDNQRAISELQKETHQIHENLRIEKMNSADLNRQLFTLKQQLMESQQNIIRLTEENTSLRDENTKKSREISETYDLLRLADSQKFDTNSTAGRLQEELSRLKDEVEVYKKEMMSVNQVNAQLNVEIANLRIQKVKMETELQSFEGLRSALTSQNQSLQLQVQQLHDSKDEQSKSLYTQIGALQIELDLAQQKIQSFHSFQREHSETNETDRRIIALKAAEYEQQIHELQEHLQVVVKENSELRNALTYHETELTTVEELTVHSGTVWRRPNDRNGNDSYINELNSRLERLETELIHKEQILRDEIGILQSKNYIIQQELDNTKQEYDYMEKRIVSLEESLQASERHISELQEDLTTRERHIIELRHLHDEQVTALKQGLQWESSEKESVVQRFDQQIESLNKQREENEKEIADLKGQVEEYHRRIHLLQQEQLQNRNLIEKLKQDLNNSQQALIRETEHKGTMEEKLSNQALNLDRKSQEYSIEISKLENQIRELESRERTVNERNGALQKQLETLYKIYDRFEGIFSGIKEHYEDQIEVYFRKLSSITEDGFGSQLREIYTKDMEILTRSNEQYIQKNNELSHHISHCEKIISVTDQDLRNANKQNEILQMEFSRYKNQYDFNLDNEKQNNMKLSSELNIMKSAFTELEEKVDVLSERLSRERQDAAKELSKEAEAHHKTSIQVQTLTNENTSLMHEIERLKYQLEEERHNSMLWAELAEKHERQEVIHQQSENEKRSLVNRLEDVTDKLHKTSMQGMENQRTWMKTIHQQVLTHEKMSDYIVSMQFQSESVNGIINSLADVVPNVLTTLNSLKRQDDKMLDRIKLILDENCTLHNAYNMLQEKFRLEESKHSDALQLLRMENTSLKSLLDSANSALSYKSKRSGSSSGRPTPSPPTPSPTLMHNESNSQYQQTPSIELSLQTPTAHPQYHQRTFSPNQIHTRSSSKSLQHGTGYADLFRQTSLNDRQIVTSSRHTITTRRFKSGSPDEDIYYTPQVERRAHSASSSRKSNSYSPDKFDTPSRTHSLPRAK